VARFPAVILGGGLVTSLGRGLPAHAAALASGEARPGRSPLSFAGEPLAFHFAGPGGGAGAALLTLVEHAVGDALAEARLPPGAAARLGIFVGSTSINLPMIEADCAAQHARGAPLLAAAPHYDLLARDIAERFAIEGPQYTFNTACSSSANAALYARAMLAEGCIEHALVVGAEGYARMTLLGFASMMLLTRAGYRPFDRARDGMILGEGAGAVVLGRAGPANAPAIIGSATACDASSPTGSEPGHLAGVMREALDDAGLVPSQLVAIKAHGTGSPGSDLAEGQALRRVFGDAPPPLTSIKPYTGHTLGACGVIELCGMLACWREGFLPPTPGFADPDPALGLSLLAQRRDAGAGAMLCNFFGFGGNNTCLVLRHGP
jgi:3-oxoacyl-(acyl-carrier-protein) synthase